jgi:pyridoxine/pyridoxamine 5'-phosphate oxidase
MSTASASGEEPPASGTGPRSAQQRKQDALARLGQDVDAWVASASPDGAPYLIPLSFSWDGAAITVATPGTSRTGRNLAATKRARVAVGPSRDLVLIEGSVEVFTSESVPAAVADAFAAKQHWDPRPLGYGWYRITARLIQAWREEDELAGRDLMRDGRWLV